MVYMTVLYDVYGIYKPIHWTIQPYMSLYMVYMAFLRPYIRPPQPCTCCVWSVYCWRAHARQHTILALNWIQTSGCSFMWWFLANQTMAWAYARGSPYCCVRWDSRCQFTQWRFLRDVLFLRELRVSFPFLAIRSKLCFWRHFLTLSEASCIAFTKKCARNEMKVSCLTKRMRSWSDELPPHMFTHFYPLLVHPYCYCRLRKCGTWNHKIEACEALPSP